MDFKPIAIAIIYTWINFIYLAHLQTIQYATRMRNFSIWSDTGYGHMISMKIFQHNMDHCVALKNNVTKDIPVKYIQVEVHRCVYEKSACEYFHKITIDKNLKGFLYMKNQFWTPALESFKPPLNFPVVKKGVYVSERLTCDAAGFIIFYPEAANYYFQLEATVFDFDDKKATVIWMELSFHSFVKRKSNRNRGNSSTRA